jgi:hypothetical protein
MWLKVLNNGVKAEIEELVERAFVLLKDFLIQNAENPKHAWETLVKLQEVMDRLKHFRPPRPFPR